MKNKGLKALQTIPLGSRYKSLVADLLA